ncbi:hypothetical protein PSHT_09789 [Puccinia striiformis]|uniref:BED-type domain-containing protein n=1 Tax=Puccinia striiformis TaxID=27350 RepID=A0A2S4VEA3_9BASI|nr:hypothetical protein PSHT_09789 [Puccinia striiformis]
MAAAREKKKQLTTPIVCLILSHLASTPFINTGKPKQSGPSIGINPPFNQQAGVASNDQLFLGRAQQVAINVLSPSYNSYLPPVLSSQLDKQGRQMIAFECKMCGIKINRPTLDSSCSNLIKHASNCLRKQSQSRLIESLAAVGIRGTGDIDPREVPQLCAVWCTEAARPFTVLVDASHWAILHLMASRTYQHNKQS